MTSLDTDDQTGRVLGGRYRLITLVGSGASAHVYLAEDTNLRRRVAVKVLHPALAGDELFLKRFRTEARAAAVLNHPNIMAIHDWGYDDGPYLVSELLGGGSLRAMYDAGHVLSPSQALVVGLGAARGLEYAHGRQLVHRDIKPANLLFDDDGRLRIADFGLARALAEAATTEPAGSLVGTVRYASPEQAKGEKVSEKADVYSLALVLCEAVTGEVPFVADTTIGTLMARVDTPLEPPEELGPMRSAVARAGSLEPDDRPTAAEFVTSLLAAAEDLPRPRPLPLAGAFADRDRADREALDATMVAGVEAESRLASPTDLDDLDDLDPGSAASRRSADAASPELTRRRAWPWVVVGLVLLALAGVGGWFAWDATRTPTHTVPALRGEEVQAAVATLSELGFDVEVVDGRDDEIPPDFVIRTEPAEGETLAEGEPIIVRRSLGPTTVPVPDDLVGLTVDDARVRLEAVELRVGAVTEVFDEELPEGQVVGVDLAATQTELPKGSEVPLLVSQGPEPRQIPELAGQSPDEATATLEGLGLVVATDEAFSDSVDEGLVVAVQPEPGTEVERGGTVTLVISLGPEPIPVPGVVGLGFDEARATLEGAGFDVNFSGDPDDTICGQRPVAGETADRGATVNITTDC